MKVEKHQALEDIGKHNLYACIYLLLLIYSVFRYFGRARDLPGVRELFEQEVAEPVNRSITEINRDIDANYYGYHDEENQVLLEYEKALEQELAQKLRSTPVESLEKE